jgi:hypothetical protein
MAVKTKGFTLTGAYVAVLSKDFSRPYMELINQSGADVLVNIGSEASPASDLDSFIIPAGTGYFTTIPMGETVWCKGTGKLVVLSEYP